MLLISPNPMSLWPWLTRGCWGTHNAEQPGPSAVLPVPEAEPWPQSPAAACGFAVYPQAPAFPGFPGHPVMHPGFPIRRRCPAAPPVPAVQQGHVSHSTARPPSEPCGCAAVPLPAEPSEPRPHTSSFCPEKQPLSPGKQQVMQGQEHCRNPMPCLLFSALPLFLQVSGVPASCHSRPMANQPASPPHVQWGWSPGTT